MRYLIYEGNMDRLTKKLKVIQTKCAKYNCDFTFRKEGVEFKEVFENGVISTVKFIIVEAEGKAIVNGWEYVATIEHTEKGNIIKTHEGAEIPSRYFEGAPVCEHCNSKRARAATYLVRNTETNEFKQVGKSCLKDFTNGLSAEYVTQYISFFDELIKGEAPSIGGRYTKYYEVQRYLRFVYECIEKFGYEKTDSGRPTSKRALNYLNLMDNDVHYMMAAEAKEWEAEMKEVNFNENSEAAVASVKEALQWINQLQVGENNYLHNLQVACSLDFIGVENLGIVASLVPTFNRDLEARARVEKARMAALDENFHLSEWVGTVGDRITIEVEEFVCLTSWETQYGITRVYKFVSKAGDVFTWKTGNYFEDCKQLIGTVKAHNEFRGVNQTELTRCKVL